MIIKRSIIGLFSFAFGVILLINLCLYFGLHTGPMPTSQTYFGFSSLIQALQEMPQELNAKWFQEWLDKVIQAFAFWQQPDFWSGLLKLLFGPIEFIYRVVDLIFNFIMLIGHFIYWFVRFILGGYRLPVPTFPTRVL